MEFCSVGNAVISPISVLFLALSLQILSLIKKFFGL